MKKLITFGDSWTVGAELGSEEKNYGELLAELLGIYHENYGISGSSNDEIFLQLQKYCSNTLLKNEDTIAVFFITSPTRSLYIDYDSNRYQLFPRNDRNDGDRNYYFFKYFYSDKQENLRLYLCLNALQNLCREYKIKDYYVIGWADIDLDSACVNKNKFYPKTCAQMFNAPAEHEFTMAKSNKYVYPNNCHPNQAGHQLIAENLYDWIKNA